MSRSARIGIGASAFIIFSCLVIFSVRQLLPSRLNGFPVKEHPAVEVYHAPKKNIWSDLEVSEFEEILKFLYTVPNELNLTRAENATAWDNHIAVVEVLHPNKTDALRYFDSDDAVPPRYARLIINQGATEQAGLLEYSIGPLPPSQETKIEPLIWPYNSGRNFVKNPLPNYEDIVRWFAALGNEVTDVIDDLLGEVLYGIHKDESKTNLLSDHSRAKIFQGDTTGNGSVSTSDLE
jgi:primary-amine oxidase